MPGRLWCAPGRREAPGLPGRHLPRWQPAWAARSTLAPGRPGRPCPRWQPAWSAWSTFTPERPGRPCPRWRPARSAWSTFAAAIRCTSRGSPPLFRLPQSVCPLRKVCLLLLVDVLLCARKWWVKERGDHLRKAGGGQKMKGWKEGGQRTKEGERVLRQRKPRGGTQSNAALRP